MLGGADFTLQCSADSCSVAGRFFDARPLARNLRPLFRAYGFAAMGGSNFLTSCRSVSLALKRISSCTTLTQIHENAVGVKPATTVNAYHAAFESKGCGLRELHCDELMRGFVALSSHVSDVTSLPRIRPVPRASEVIFNSAQLFFSVITTFADVKWTRLARVNQSVHEVAIGGVHG